MFPLVFRRARRGRATGPVLAVTLVPLLAACIPAQPDPGPAPVILGDPAVASGKAGTNAALSERTPDSCRKGALQALIGQPAGNLRTVRLAGGSRIIPPGGIVSQEDYNPQRINAYIDNRGVITRLECG